jgi:hypothetical protein
VTAEADATDVPVLINALTPTRGDFNRVAPRQARPLPTPMNRIPTWWRSTPDFLYFAGGSL